jgi:hypothetical protein
VLCQASWYKNNLPLVMSQRHSCHNDEAKRIVGVKIKGAQPEDSGVYSLVVENPYGADDSSCQLVVAEPPRPRLTAHDSTAAAHSPLPDAPHAQPQQSGSGSMVPPRFVAGVPANGKVSAHSFSCGGNCAFAHSKKDI